MINDKKQCSNCVHFKMGAVDPNTMQKTTICTRYPPVTHPILTQGGIMMMSIFNNVSDELYCGEFRLENAPLNIISLVK